MVGQVLTACFAASFIALALTAALVRWPERFGLWDVPNARSSHAAPKPRTGGMAIFVAWCAGFFLLPGRAPGDWAIFTAVCSFFLLGLTDDRWRLPEGLRFAVQVAISAALAAVGLRFKAIAFPGFGVAELPIAVSVALTVFWICGFVNLFNFMDGIDGIAAGHAAIAGLFLGVMASERPALIAAAAAASFLVFNFPPARIFMGDSGSYLLGATLAISVARGSGRVPLPALILVLGAFVADTAVTLARRVLAGEIWFKAHRSHFYQRLVSLGWSHGRVTLLYSALSLTFGVAAVCYTRVGGWAQAAILTGCSAIVAALFVWIVRAERQCEISCVR